MNTGIGDAVNLREARWRNTQTDRPGGVDSCQTERIAFARRLVATTDRAFAFATAYAGPCETCPSHRRATLLPMIFHVRAIRRFMFRTISQIEIRYPNSWLSSGRAGTVSGGDRLPWAQWIDGAETRRDNYEFFLPLDWQLHRYGEPSDAVRATCASRGLALHAFVCDWRCTTPGLHRNAIYLVRPDEYVGFAGRAAGDAAALERYLDQHHWARLQAYVDHRLPLE